MKLQYLALNQLKLSPLNVRKHGGEDVSDLLHTLKAQGVLQSLLVRPDGDLFEVVAGKRRYTALTVLAAESPVESVPCIVMEEGDDAAAIEASLAENIARLPMDELDQFAAFAALVKQGRTVPEIADHFGVTERLVEQRLALAGLDRRILVLYRKGDIQGETLRALTLATKAQQKAWLKSYRDPDEYAPQGRQLRQWLLGGQQIATSAALFSLEDYKGAIVTDLFGDESFFADPEVFWHMQHHAIRDSAASYAGRGWSDVVVLDRTAHFPAYEYKKAPKSKGGKVYVTVASNGEVAFHEGYLDAKEARQAEKKAAREAGDETVRQAKPELTKAAQNYVDLHRHAAVQAALLNHWGVALRLVAAHMIAGSSLWQVKPDKGRADKPEIRASVEASAARAAVLSERKAVLVLLGYDIESDDGPLVDHSWTGKDLGGLFAKLTKLEDADVIRVMTYAMAETLDVQSGLIDVIGADMGVSLAGQWEADDAFLGSIGNKMALAAMLEDIGGKITADAHKASTGKTVRSVILQYASGDGRPKAEDWVPPYLRFPASAYLSAPDSGLEGDADEDELEAAA